MPQDRHRTCGTARETGGPSPPPSAPTPRAMAAHEDRSQGLSSGSSRTQIVRAGDVAIGGGKAGVDLEPDCLLSRINERHLRIDALTGAEQCGLGNGAWDIGARRYVARCNTVAVAILHDDAQERQRQRLRSCILQARANGELAAAVRFGGGSELADLVRGQIP